METKLDWTSLQRLDNAFVIDFLTAAASALSESGEIDSHEIDALRVSLSGAQEMASAQGGPLLCLLDRMPTEFVARLSARFGTTGLCLNLWRSSITRSLGETHRVLGNLGAHLTRRAETLFNRPLAQWSHHECERHVLASEALLELAKRVDHSLTQLNSVKDALALMLPADIALEDEKTTQVDLSLAEALGFSGVASIPSDATFERQALGRVTAIGHDLAEALRGFLRQLQQNGFKHGIDQALSLSDWLFLEIQQAEAIALPTDHNLESMELRRQRLLWSMAGIRHSLQGICLFFETQLRPSDAVDPLAMPIPHSVTRALAQDLMRHSVPPTKAIEAATALVRHCQTHHLRASEIITAELPKIHSHLMARTLELFQQLDKERGTLATRGERKDRVLRSLKSLGARFQTGATVLALTLSAFMATSLFSCGVKKPPRSDISDTRPAIPFRSSVPDFIESEEAAPPPPETLQNGFGEEIIP
jgi:hypothetical protein